MSRNPITISAIPAIVHTTAIPASSRAPVTRPGLAQRYRPSGLDRRDRGSRPRIFAHGRGSALEDVRGIDA
ncbi:hypothetical protein SAMN04488242_0016 [Tessaracoccus oleiagri]|uniref:Uncharacterized protein n=1 Tax=Tessaracoccus oleiagri TaxID=686624 RepID=A0A1G9H175_9ACTN|nr:hypothetical protein SAMN04488242_0016 [Tessaracoccus oleiagri]